MHRITQYGGLYGDPNARPDAEYLFSELLETRSHAFDWVIHPHTHVRLYQVFFLEVGSVDFSEVTQKRQLNAQSFC